MTPSIANNHHSTEMSNQSNLKWRAGPLLQAHQLGCEPASPQPCPPRWCRSHPRPPPDAPPSIRTQMRLFPVHLPPRGVPTCPRILKIAVLLLGNVPAKSNRIGELIKKEHFPVHSPSQQIRYSPRMDTLDKNSSYIFRFLIVEPMRIRLYESLSIPHSLVSVLAFTVACLGVP